MRSHYDFTGSQRNSPDDYEKQALSNINTSRCYRAPTSGRGNVSVGTVKKSKATIIHITMVGEEGEPLFGRIAAAPQALQISGDSALGDFDAELQKFPVDLRCSPARIFSRHAANESPNLHAHLGSAAARPRSPAPVQAKAHPMPSDHRLWFHNDQNIGPSRAIGTAA